MDIRSDLRRCIHGRLERSYRVLVNSFSTFSGQVASMAVARRQFRFEGGTCGVPGVGCGEVGEGVGSGAGRASFAAGDSGGVGLTASSRPRGAIV